MRSYETDILSLQERTNMIEAIKSAVISSSAPTIAPVVHRQGDVRNSVHISNNKPNRVEDLVLYTDYEMLKELNNKLSFPFKVTSTQEDANFLFIMRNIRNFLEIEPRLSQFPYEGGFVRKVAILSEL